MLTCNTRDGWVQFLQYIKTKCSAIAFGNWFEPIRVLNATEQELVLEVPNIFVQEYVISNYQKDLCSFLPLKANGEPAISFVIASGQKKLTYFLTFLAAKRPKKITFFKAFFCDLIF